MPSSSSRLLDYWADIPDPRMERCRAHRLIDILMIAVCGALCGADNWVAMAEFGRAKADWLKTFLALPNGIPSHDTFGRVFARVSPWHFQACFSLGAIVDAPIGRPRRDRATGGQNPASFLRIPARVKPPSTWCMLGR